VKQLKATFRIREYRPKIPLSSFLGVLDASAQCQQRSHAWLKDESKAEAAVRASEKVVPAALDHVHDDAHTVTPPSDFTINRSNA
jgi:hypothetical protein